MNRRIYLVAVLAIVILAIPSRAAPGVAPAPPCKNSETTCPPWERDWHGTPLAPGTVVTLQGVVYASPARPMVSFLYIWQTLIAGALAIVAALIGAIAAYKVGNVQIRAARSRDRLQARGIVVGVYPELFSVEAQRDRAIGIITEQFPRVAGGMTNGIVATIQSARIDLPPLLLRNVDNLFLVEPGGASLLQLLSITMQYNDLVDTLAKQIAQNVNTFNPATHRQDLTGHLTAIGQALTDARREIGPIHDEAT